MNFQKLIPNFLKKIDKNLLLNAPAVWSSRVHIVLFFSAVISAVLYAYFFLVNADARQDSSEFVSVSFISVLIIIGLVLYVMYLLRFNVFKRFGTWSNKDSLLTFLFAFISAASIIFWGFIPSIASANRANKTYNYAQLIQDQNTVNKNICLLHADSLMVDILEKDLHSLDTNVALQDVDENSIQTPQSVEAAATNAADLAAKEAVANIPNPNTNFYTNAYEFKNKMASVDSLLVINDTAFREYAFPELQILDNESRNEQVQLLTNKELYYYLLANKNKPLDKNLMAKQIIEITKKYVTPQQIAIASMYTNERYENFDRSPNGKVAYVKGFFADRYNAQQMNSSIRNIMERKDAWRGSEWSMRMHVWYYLALFCGVLLFIFRHSTTRAFFLAILSVNLLSLFTAPIIVFTGVENAIFFIVYAYLTVLIILAVSILKFGHRSMVQGIALNILVAFTVLIPTFIVATYYKYLDDTTKYDANRDYSIEKNHYLIAEFLGFGLLIITIYFVYARLYKKWYAQPEL